MTVTAPAVTQQERMKEDKVMVQKYSLVESEAQRGTRRRAANSKVADVPQGMADMPDSTADVSCSSPGGGTAGSESGGGDAQAAVPRVSQYSPAATGGGKAGSLKVMQSVWSTCRVVCMAVCGSGSGRSAQRWR